MPAGEALDALGGIGEDGTPRMPGRTRWLAWCWGSLAASVALVAATAAVRLDAVVLVIQPLAQLLVFGGLPLLRRVRLRRLLTDGRYRTVSADAISAAVCRAAGSSGVHAVTVRVGPVGGFARCFRAGGRAVLLIHERLPERPDAARFLIAHEAAHLARYDAFRRPATVMTALTGCYCLGAIWPPLLVPGALAVVAVVALLNRAGELDCDRLAVRRLGPASAEQAFALAQAAYRGTVRSMLIHPSPGRRLAASRTTKA